MSEEFTEMDNEKQDVCAVVQDLLPLYHDGVCSDESRRIVANHINQCESCARLAKQLDNNEVENNLGLEKSHVLKDYARKEKKRTTTVGMITAGVLLIPVIVCLICNLAVGHALDWFFIVLVSLMVLASVTVVPLLCGNNRGMWTLISFTVSLVALLGTIALYTGGKWFFLAVVPSLFGLTVCFLPYVLWKLRLPGVLGRMKGAICMLIDTIFLYILLWVCGFQSTSPSYGHIAYGIAGVCVVFAWILFLIIRYFKVSGFSRAGIVTILCGMFAPFIDRWIDYVLEGEWRQIQWMIDFTHWNSSTIESNVYAIIVAACIFTGIGLMINGCVRGWKKQ